MKERLTTYHCGKAVIKDKNKLSEAMEKLAKLEDDEPWLIEDLKKLEVVDSYE